MSVVYRVWGSPRSAGAGRGRQLGADGAARPAVVRQAVRAVSQQSRAATGVQLQKLDENDIVASITIIPASVAIEEQRKAEAIEEAEIAGEGDAAAADEGEGAAAADEPEG